MLFEVPFDKDKSRLDVFLTDQSGSLSRNQAVRLIETGEVTVNSSKQVSKNFKVRGGDMVEVSESALISHSSPPDVYPVVPENIPFEVIYEDDDLAVISKPRNLVSHPSPGHEKHTLVNGLLSRFGKEHLGTLQGSDKLGLVHRLDMDTTGLMLIAKNDEIQQKLQDAIKMREVDRRYLTLVHGNIVPPTGLIDVGMARSSRHRIKMMATADPGAREAITTFQTLEHFVATPHDDGFTLLECHLMTGRTHQIRLHMNYIHHPVVGDPLYGTGDACKNLQAPRQFLHSYRLSFDHPRTCEHLSFIEPLPPDLKAVLASLSNRSLGKTDAGKTLPKDVLANEG